MSNMVTFFVCEMPNLKSDDPFNAIIYFHPSETPVSHQHSLYSQIMGVTQFLKLTFSSPSIMTLERDSYAICPIGDYFMVLGKNHKTSGQQLKLQLRFMYLTFSFYHCSITDVLNECNCDKSLFLKKMKDIWDHCVAVTESLSSASSLGFYSVPLASFSQALSVSTDAKALIRMCQECSDVIGGAVFCRERVLYSSKISSDIISCLTLLNFGKMPHSHELQLVLPAGVTMVQTYFTPKELRQERLWSSVEDINHVCHYAEQLHSITPVTQRQQDSHSSSESDHVPDVSSFEGRCHVPGSSVRTQDTSPTNKDSRFCPQNLLCNQHQGNFIASNTSQKKSSTDVEFRCWLCSGQPELIGQLCSKYQPQLKRVRSEADLSNNELFPISSYFSSVYEAQVISSCSHRRKRSSKPIKIMQPFQKDRSTRSQQNSLAFKFNINGLHSGQTPSTSTETNVQRMSVVYIQKYENCTLVLVMKKCPLESIVNYLYTCGLFILCNIAYETRRFRPPSLKCKGKFQSFSYSYATKMFKDQSHWNKPNSSEERNSLLQSIHEKLCADPLLHTISVAGYQTKGYFHNSLNHQMLYEQVEQMNHKSNWFSFSRLKENFRCQVEKYRTSVPKT